MSIDFDDISELNVAAPDEDALIKARIQQIRALVSEGAITAENALEMPTSILVMSIIKFPDLLVEAGSLIPYATEAGDAETVQELHTALNVISESLNACVVELDERCPSRK